MSTAAVCTQHRGETDKALEAYQKALELEPTRRLAYTNVINAYLELGQLDEAQAMVERQIKALGETPETNQRLYDIAARKGDRATTDRLAAVLENSSAASTFLGTRADEMVYFGRFDEWQKLTARQIELLKRQGLDERVGIVRSSQAVTAMFLGETKLARMLAEEVTQKSLETSANLAICFAALGDETRARQQFREVDLRSVPDDVANSVQQDISRGARARRGTATESHRAAEGPANGSEQFRPSPMPSWRERMPTE